MNYYKTLIKLNHTMAIANNNEEKPLIIYTFKKLCYGEQWLAAQQSEQLVLKKLKELKINKGPGPDDLHPRLLFEL